MKGTKPKKPVTKTKRVSKPQKRQVVGPEEMLGAMGVSEFVDQLPENRKEELRENLWGRLEFDAPYAVSNQERFVGAPGKFTILREWNYIERREVLERSHQAWERNPLANSAVTYTTQFSIGDGGSFSFYSNEVREIIQEFIDDKENMFKAYEKEFCDGIQVDGELFVRFFKNSQGKIKIAPLRPWHIQWITTDPEFFQRKLSYHYVYSIYKDEPTQVQYGQEDIPADEVLHVAINKQSYELRGRPELFRVLPWLRAYKDWLEDRARINKRKGALLYDVALKNARPDQVTNKMAQYQQPPSSGSLVIHNDNEVWQVLSAKIEAGDAAEDGRQFKLMVAAGMRLPEYMFADGANANLASARAQQLPALRKFTNFQDILTNQVWKPIFKMVIQAAIDAGRIEETVQQVDSMGKPMVEEASPGQLFSQAYKAIKSGNLREAFGVFKEMIDQGAMPKTIKAVDAFDYRYPDLEASDPQTLAAAMAIMQQNKWVSKATATHELGFDPTKEAEQIAREDAEELNRQLEQANAFGGLMSDQGDMGGGFGQEQQPGIPPLGGQNPNQNPNTNGKQPVGEQK